jgi:YLP motif-containing protein 1
LQRSGYEAYILEATYKDPTGCAARNVHGITVDQVQQMAEQWEEAPSLYMQLDIKSFTRWDDLKENEIQEVIEKYLFVPLSWSKQGLKNSLF